LEKAGAIIDGVVSDGATTNRKLWLRLGINGEKGKYITNAFQHPLESKSRIYMLSDPPHLIKNVRNRFYNKKALRVNHLINTTLAIYLFTKSYIYYFVGVTKCELYKVVTLRRCAFK